MRTLAIILFILLSPGVLLTIPPLSKRGLFMSGKTSTIAVFVHAIVFGAALYLLQRASAVEGFQTATMSPDELAMQQMMQAPGDAADKAMNAVLAAGGSRLDAEAAAIKAYEEVDRPHMEAEAKAGNAVFSAGGSPEAVQLAAQEARRKSMIAAVRTAAISTSPLQVEQVAATMPNSPASVLNTVPATQPSGSPLTPTQRMLASARGAEAGVALAEYMVGQLEKAIGT